MTVREKINEYGGIVDFGAVVSTPWAIYADGTLAMPQEYHEAMQIKSRDRNLRAVKFISAKRFKSTKWLVVKSYKIFGITVYNRYHKGVLYKFI